MIKLIFSTLILSSTLSVAAKPSYLHFETKKETLLEALKTKVLTVIQHTPEIPGLSQEQWNSVRSETEELWKTLVQTESVESREKSLHFIALQKIIEHALTHLLNEDVHELKGCIVGPAPALPFCEEALPAPEFTDASIEGDFKRLITVSPSSVTLRTFLQKGFTLISRYPPNSLRTEKELQIYQETLNTYPSLVDNPTAHLNRYGSTYYFEDQKGQTYAFHVKCQEDDVPYSLWLGALSFSKKQNSYSEVK